LQRKPTRKGLAAIYRQEIIQDVTLLTSQRAANFYDKLFSSLDFTLPRAATGRRGFPKEAMVCAFIVMKCEGFTQITDLMDFRKLDTEKVKLNIRPFDLISMIDDLLLPFISFVKRRHITLQACYHLKGLSVNADPTYLHRV
jgi:hypothetical protein